MNTIAPSLQSLYILCPSNLCGAAKDTMTILYTILKLDIIEFKIWS